jgi:tRNA G37 N-methylase TrmD
VCAGVTALTFEMIHAICTDGIWTGFSTYFAYSIVFYAVAVGTYILIVGEIVKMILNSIIKFIRKI